MASRTLLRLNTASIYHSYHGMQDRDTHLTLRQYKQKMKWSKRHKILDIGCGPGDLTVNYLLPLIPKNGEMLGVDISQAMIQYANSQYKDPRLKFEVMDIAGPDIREKYRRTFNSVFSFYCLHWVQDQWNTMRNIYDVLQTGGEALLIFLATSPIYTLYETLGRTKKWSPFMHDFREVISPYHYSSNPETDVRNLLLDVGFAVKDCYCKPTTYTMPTKEVLYKSIQAVNPFLSRIPEHLIDEYNRDCQAEISNGNLCVVSEETDEVTFSYSLITVYATKPNFNHQP